MTSVKYQKPWRSAAAAYLKPEYRLGKQSENEVAFCMAQANAAEGAQFFGVAW